MTVIPNGSAVSFGQGDDAIVGTTLSFRVSGSSHVEYEVVWWDGRSRHCEWLAAEELTVMKPTKQLKVGFS